jgi:hypothetical protein
MLEPSAPSEHILLTALLQHFYEETSKGDYPIASSCFGPIRHLSVPYKKPS